MLNLKFFFSFSQCSCPFFISHIFSRICHILLYLFVIFFSSDFFGRCFHHGFYNRWLLISLCALMELIRHFDLLKVFGYNESVIKSDFFFGKRPFLHYTCATCNKQLSNIKIMGSFPALEIMVEIQREYE